MTRKFKDLTGNRYSRLIVLARSGKSADGHRLLWKCVCDCGNYIIVRGRNLVSGNTKSCGCLQDYGDSGTHFRRKWDGMRNRCNSEKLYIKNNIMVDPRWNTYKTFKKDMYESYLAHIREYGKKDTELDRKDNDGPYSPENCRWVTHRENCQNKDHRVKENIYDEATR